MRVQDDRIVDAKNLKGENELGKILTEYRDAPLVGVRKPSDVELYSHRRQLRGILSPEERPTVGAARPPVNTWPVMF